MVDQINDDEEIEKLKECFSGSGHPGTPVKAVGFVSPTKEREADDTDRVNSVCKSAQSEWRIDQPDGDISPRDPERESPSSSLRSDGEINPSDDKRWSNNSNADMQISSGNASISVNQPGMAPCEPPGRSQPLRGKTYTMPAWMTANLGQCAPSLALTSPEGGELECIEEEIEKVKAEISELEKTMELKRSLRDKLRTQYASLIQTSSHQKPSGIGRVRFSVDLERRGSPIGLSVAYDDTRRGFLVSEVKSEGIIPQYNKNNSCKVQVGDLIVSVNGVGGNREEMTKEFKSNRVVLMIEPPKPTSNSAPRPLLAQKLDRLDTSKYSPQSLEAYYEITEALRSREGPRTGIMRLGDVPIRCAEMNVFSCDVCKTALRSDSEWIEHFKSIQHSHNRANISTPDLWSRYSLENGQKYWYEHKIGFWAVDEPNKSGIGSHTVAITNNHSYSH